MREFPTDQALFTNAVGELYRLADNTGAFNQAELWFYFRCCGFVFEEQRYEVSAPLPGQMRIDFLAEAAARGGWMAEAINAGRFEDAVGLALATQ